MAKGPKIKEKGAAAPAPGGADAVPAAKPGKKPSKAATATTAAPAKAAKPAAAPAMQLKREDEVLTAVVLTDSYDRYV
jgi:hypothetical protein